MKRDACNYTARTLAQKVLGLVCFLLGSGGIMNWQNWVFFGSNILLITPIALAWVYRTNPGVLASRSRIAPDTPTWDKVLFTTYWFTNFFVVYLFAGWGARWAAAPLVSFWLGMVLVVVAAVLATAALVVNPYLEATARIQEDRNQVVVTEGAYSLMRHPTYAAGLVGCVAVALVFSSTPVWIVSAVIVALLILRTHLEDKMLLQELPGYLQYAQKTRHRLIPFVW